MPQAVAQLQRPVRRRPGTAAASGFPVPAALRPFRRHSPRDSSCDRSAAIGEEILFHQIFQTASAKCSDRRCKRSLRFIASHIGKPIDVAIKRSHRDSGFHGTGDDVRIAEIDVGLLDPRQSVQHAARVPSDETRAY